MSQVCNFTKIRPVWMALFHMPRQTGGQTFRV